ncbi:MAG: type 4a pilus biogenesis protein PilO [Methylophilus sp.]|nr:type 4a pilus biogenesis protein PilO [Methylophilus sp.]
MNQINITYLYWFAAHSAKKLGIWGIIGLALIIASALFYVTKISQLDQLTQALVLEHQTAQSHDIHEIEAPKEPPVQDTAQEIATFYERFPVATHLPEILAQINQLASKQKVELNSGDYKLNKVKPSSSTQVRTLTKYEITFPVKGQYTKIRAFIAEVLQKQPAIALADIQIRRENTLSPSVEARLVLVLFVKGESW